MTIAEVGRKFDLSADTLRYYERIGLIPPVHRSQSGLRDYDEQDCKWIEFIKCMRSAGLTIEVLTKYVEMFLQGDETLKQREALLIEQRDQLKGHMVEMQKTLDRLNLKIERYEQLVNGKIKELREPDVARDLDTLLG